MEKYNFLDVNIIYSKRTTKIWKNNPLFLTFLVQDYILRHLMLWMERILDICIKDLKKVKFKQSTLFDISCLDLYFKIGYVLAFVSCIGFDSIFCPDLQKKILECSTRYLLH